MLCQSCVGNLDISVVSVSAASCMIGLKSITVSQPLLVGVVCLVMALFGWLLFFVVLGGFWSVFFVCLFFV